MKVDNKIVAVIIAVVALFVGAGLWISNAFGLKDKTGALTAPNPPNSLQPTITVANPIVKKGAQIKYSFGGFKPY